MRVGCRAGGQGVCSVAKRKACSLRGGEDVAGIHRWHPSRILALAVGSSYVLVGLVGFAVTGFDHWVTYSGATLLGFGLNGFHNIVHLGVGLLLVAAAIQRDPAVTQGVLIGGGAVYLLATFLGFTNHLDQLLSISGPLAADNFLHLASGVAAVLAGLIGRKRAADETLAGGPAAAETLAG